MRFALNKSVRCGAMLAILMGVSSAAAEEPPSSTAPEATPAPYPNTIPVKVTEKEPPPPAQESQSASVLQEVTVTAQKIKQSARDVPISMSVMSDKFVAEHGITDIVQAMQYVPNVKIASGGFFAAPQARGFSFNNNNKAFESPLGIAFDGIPYTNTTYFNAGLFDIQRVEVLRGPQGTTFGKNTTAGLVSIVTADPTSDFTGVASVQYGQLGRHHYEGAFGGPIIRDFLEFRVALVKDDLAGYIHNTTPPFAGASGAYTEDGHLSLLHGYTHNGYRAKLLFPDLFGTRFKISYESVSLDSLGAGIQDWEVSQPVQTVMFRYDPNANITLGTSYASEDGPDYRYAHTKTFVGEWTIPFGGWEATVLGGWSQLKETLAIDTDFSPVPAINGYGADRFPTTSLEFRVSSPHLDGLFGLNHLFGLELGHTDFLAGVFYQRRSIRDSNLRFVLNDGPLLELTAAAETPDEGVGTSVAGTYLNLLSAFGLSAAEAQARQEAFNQVFDQTGKAFAVFQQTEWYFLPNWSILAGLRLSKEIKTGIWNDVFDTSGGMAGNPVSTALGFQAFSDSRELSETQLQPKISLNYKPSKQLSVFAHWTRGFKSGGFNAFAYRNNPPEELTYKPETMSEWALDFKGSFFGGKLRPDLSIYRMNARNFQVLGREKPPVVDNPTGQGQTCTPVGSTELCVPPATVIGLGPTRVFNAESAYAQGVEATLNWLAFGGFSTLATLGYNDTKYVKFTQNECPANINRTTCDASGKPFPFAPRWDATLTPSWIIPLFWGTTLTPSFTAQYISHQFLDTHLTHEQGGFMRYNATLALGNVVQGWTLQVIGNNLGDKRTSVRYGDVLPNYEIAVPESPRQIYAQVRYAFQ